MVCPRHMEWERQLTRAGMKSCSIVSYWRSSWNNLIHISWLHLRSHLSPNGVLGLWPAIFLRNGLLSCPFWAYDLLSLHAMGNSSSRPHYDPSQCICKIQDLSQLIPSVSKFSLEFPPLVDLVRMEFTRIKLIDGPASWTACPSDHFYRILLIQR